MKLLTLLLCLIVACSVVSVSWAGLTIPLEGADVGPAVITPLGDDDPFVALDITLHPFKPSEKRVDTPTNLNEVLAWSKDNLGVDIPFEGDADTLIKPLGLGVSEAVKVGTVGGAPVRFGLVYLFGRDAAYFIKTDLVQL